MCNKCMKQIEIYWKVTEAFGFRLDLAKLSDAVGKCPAMLALEQLTPQGSEFWEDPEFCAYCIRDRREKQWQLLKQKIIELKKLKEGKDEIH